MVYNKTNVLFAEWMQELKRIATEDYSFELGYNFNETEFFEYYTQGCDIYEAIFNHENIV